MADDLFSEVQLQQMQSPSSIGNIDVFSSGMFIFTGIIVALIPLIFFLKFKQLTKKPKVNRWLHQFK